MAGTSSSSSFTAHGGLAEAERRGRQLLQRWIGEGVLICEAELASTWSVSAGSLRQLQDSGELFALTVDDREWYWAGHGCLPYTDVAAVCRVQRALDPAEQLIFWMRTHGGLVGRTVSEALEAGELGRVLELARSWVEERVG